MNGVKNELRGIDWKITGTPRGQTSWDDIMYELYVKQKLEKGLKAVTDGRIVSQEEAKKRLLGNAG